MKDYLKLIGLLAVMIICIAIIFFSCGYIADNLDVLFDCGGSSSSSDVCGVCGGDGVFFDEICKNCGGWGTKK
jgi:hypothetical protein